MSDVGSPVMTMPSDNNNIYFEMDFSPGEEPELPCDLSDSEVNAR